ncbi:hypothetical protein EJ06DRAFT_504510 [Trichodelitschia bisporula]|uniref:DUF3500 domain-containing protein n=1 Tax=Trichodelitschia bisporula TaxID=703511 RepID=A0A6G1I5S5_9PEZI|nr:hypothetical protein EJ06DRAFT_504510 [Trichodelitschia bisporula]
MTPIPSFRAHLPDLNSPRFVTAREQSPYEYAAYFRANQRPPWLFALTQAWEELYTEPFKGITTDGNVILGLYPEEDDGVPIEEMVEAANALLDGLTQEQKAALTFPLAAREWRAWSNPEVLLRPLGLRLEEQPAPTVTAVHTLLRRTFSARGYARALAAMRINHFLGELVSLPRIMNADSYNILLFGTPSTEQAWGFLLYGHHLCVSVFLRGRQVVVSPVFTGAEPNGIDEGPWEGTAILRDEGEWGLRVMQSLSDEEKGRARIYEHLHDARMRQTGDLKSDRWNKDDQRHVCGAFRDNRAVPYEGVNCGRFSSEQKDLILKIADEMLCYLPDRARERRLERIGEFWDKTWFCWIGGWGDEDAFYYRIQSPVVLLEFDHHSGVFLGNEEPAKFHTHTIVRMPNGGDYGAALRGKGEEVP